MKLKSILLVGATIGLLSPLTLSNVSSQPKTVHADQTINSVQTLKTIIPPVYSNYWQEWRHVILTKPITIHVIQWYRNNLGYWDNKVVKTYQMDAGTIAYIGGYSKTFIIVLNQPKSNSLHTGYQTVLHAHITGTPNVKLINDHSNTKVGKLNYKQASVKDFNNKKWHTGYYADTGPQPGLLFSTLQQARRYDDLSEKMGDIGDETDGGTKGLSKKYLNYVKRTTIQFKAIQKAALKFSNPKKAVKVKLIKDILQMVKLNGKIYYSDAGAGSSFVTYTVQNGAGVIQSPLDPNNNQKFFITQKDDPIYLYKGEKWIGPHNWQYDGKKWVQKKNLDW